MKKKTLRSRAKWMVVGATTLASALFFVHCATEDVPTIRTTALLEISANPMAIPVVDAASTITVVGQEIDNNGRVVFLDGAVILFTTNVGVVDERAVMQNGVATVSLRSDGRAGLATVTATADQGGRAALNPPVLIGNATGLNIVLSANPATVLSPDLSSEILATAFDNDNNALRDVPIVFSTSAGALASQGSVIRTNKLGQALDRLTLRPEDDEEATVIARSGSVESNPVTVDVLTPAAMVAGQGSR
jgi:hypothetical protein